MTNIYGATGNDSTTPLGGLGGGAPEAMLGEVLVQLGAQKDRERAEAAAARLDQRAAAEDAVDAMRRRAGFQVAAGVLEGAAQIGSGGAAVARVGASAEAADEICEVGECAPDGGTAAQPESTPVHESAVTDEPAAPGETGAARTERARAEARARKSAWIEVGSRAVGLGSVGAKARASDAEADGEALKHAATVANHAADGGRERARRAEQVADHLLQGMEAIARERQQTALAALRA